MTEKAILKVETTCNTSDKQLIGNLEAVKARGLPSVPFVLQQERSLFVCGSGPSMLEYYELASKTFKDFDVMALNGAYKALLNIGVVPKYYCQLDARPENTNFVDLLHDDTTFLIASQCAPEMFDALVNRKVNVFHLNTPTTHRVFPDADCYFGGGATVGTTALAIAAFLGYRVIGVFGYDSSYSKDGKSHVRPQSQNANQKTLDVWVEDREYLSTPAMAKQVEEFRPWIATLTRTFPNIDIRMFGEGLLYDYIATGQRNFATRESEAAKYAEMYKDPSYGMSPYRAESIHSILASREKGSLLDVGTGRGETLDIARSLNYPIVSGTETVDQLIKSREDVAYGLLPNISAPDNYYDTVTCFEVMEHLLPSDVVPALRELERLAKNRVIISVCTASDVRGGVELHPSWRTESEWLDTLRLAWGIHADIKQIGNLSTLGLSPVYEYCLRSS